MYAIIATGGKQYKVSEGDIIKVEKLDVEAGNTVTFDKVIDAVEDEAGGHHGGQQHQRTGQQQTCIAGFGDLQIRFQIEGKLGIAFIIAHVLEHELVVSVYFAVKFETVLNFPIALVAFIAVIAVDLDVGCHIHVNRIRLGFILFITDHEAVCAGYGGLKDEIVGVIDIIVLKMFIGLGDGDDLHLTVVNIFPVLMVCRHTGAAHHHAENHQQG